MEQLTTLDEANLAVLGQNVAWRYQLDKFEDEKLVPLLQAFEQVRREIIKKLAREDLSEWSEQRAQAILQEVQVMTTGIQARLTSGIADMTTEAGSDSITEHNKILSFDGTVPGFIGVEMTPAQIRAIVVDVPVGGYTLKDWVNATFSSQLQAKIKQEITAGMIEGDGYPALVNRLEIGLGAVKKDCITLARTYVQNVNTSAQEAVYRENPDIVSGMKWCATLEPGYMSSGHGTCLACSALDGQVYAMKADRPPCPLHPRCRCMWLPVLKSWEDLGIPAKEIEDAARPFTNRPPQNIDAGGRRTIIEVGQHQGSYADWFAGQGERFQKNVLGPGRLALYKSGEVTFDELVDPATGRLKLLDELTGEAPPPREFIPNGPVPAPTRV